MKIFFHIFTREIILFWRRGFARLNTGIFYIMLIALFPILTTQDPKVLPLLAPGVIFAAAFFSNILVMHELFGLDFADGHLEQFLLLPYSLPLLIMAKMLGVWVTRCFPLVFLIPLLGFFLSLSWHVIFLLMFSMTLLTIFFVFLSGIVASFTLNLQNNTLLLGLVLIPFYIPAAIFATQGVLAGDFGLNPFLGLAWLGFLLILALLIAPFVIAYALRLGLGAVER